MMFRSVPSWFRTSAWRIGLHVLGPTSQHSGSMPTSVLSTMPALQPAPKTSNPWERRILARVLDSFRRPTHVAMPILL